MTDKDVSDADIAFELGKTYSKMKESGEFNSREEDAVKYAAEKLRSSNPNICSNETERSLYTCRECGNIIVVPSNDPDNKMDCRGSCDKPTMHGRIDIDQLVQLEVDK